LRKKIHDISELPGTLKNFQPIVFFDGDCTLCSSSVKFLIKHNQNASLNFASLNSDAGLSILKYKAKDMLQSDTILFLEDNILYSYSTAALKITAHLAYPWRLLGIFTIIPAGIRDYVYRFIARKRYKWFGRKSYCMPDVKALQGRFLS
jgi:predicted DCC family thiol-disulfide oxidoreductase YuxK